MPQEDASRKVNFMCQLDWSADPDVWSNVILGESVLGEFNM